MKVVFITPVVPYVDGGTSAHIYHLMLKREKDISIDIFTFNNNHRTKEEIEKVEKELNVKFHLTKMPTWIQWLLRLRLHLIRAFLNYPIYFYLKVDKNCLQEIDSIHPDGIWIYGEELANVSKQFSTYRRVHTLPDSEAMYFYRMLQQRFVTNDFKTFWKNALMFRKYVRMEKAYENSSKVTYHLVGEADAEFIRNNNPEIDAIFIRHPHYHILDETRPIKFHCPKIKILIAGQNNLYMKQAADLLVEQFKSLISPLPPIERVVETNSVGSFLKRHYVITFLGKGWEKHTETLRSVGYEVNHIIFAENYQEELIKHDIQITPIAIGTGTKGKVLDALANGLLVIGTPYAMENIAVKHGESCIEYKHPQEVVDVLMNIPKNLKKYERMAWAGREAILKYHGRSLISRTLFSIFKKQQFYKDV